MANDFRSGQLGNMAPLKGEFEIKLDSTSAEGLTILMATGASTTAGAALTVTRATSQEGSSVAGKRVFGVEYDGIWGMRKVISISTAASAVTLSASQSGAFLVLGDCTGNDVKVTLPAMEAGIWYEFYNTSPGVGTSGPLTVAAATAGDMVVYGDVAANLVRVGGTATATAEGGSLRVITDGTKWYTVMQPNLSSAAQATNTATMYDIET